MASYELRVVGPPGIDLTGEPAAPIVLTDVAPSSIRRELNAPGSATFDMAVLDPLAREIDPDRMSDREIQVWRNGVLYDWLRPKSADADDTKVAFGCAGLLDYFSQRYFGPVTTEMLQNGSFDTINIGDPNDIMYWAKVGVLGLPQADDPPEFFRTAHGTHAVRLTTELATGETAEDAEGKDAYIKQVFRVTTGDLSGDRHDVGFVTGAVPTMFHYTVNARPYLQEYDPDVPRGILLTLAGWYRTHLVTFGDGSQLWTGPAYGERGLYIARRTAGTAAGHASEVANWAPITSSTQIARWTRLETQLVLPPNSTFDVEVRCYAPGMATDWDAVTLTIPESVGSDEGGSPVATLMERIVVDAAQLRPSKRTTAAVQSTLGIGFQGTGGKTLDRDYQFADHGNILAALQELCDAGYADMAIHWTTDGLSRFLRCYPNGKGTHRADLGIRIVAAEPLGIVKSFRYTIDIGEHANSVRVLGQGSGTDREIGWKFSDPSGDHQVLEAVIGAGADTAVKELQTLADREWARRQRPVRISEITVVSEAHAATLDVGDTIDVFADFGYIQENAVYRVIWKELHPLEAQGEVLTIGLNLP